MSEPLREDEIARLLGSLRVDEPTPDDVVRRLDAALAHEHENGSAPAPGASRRRRAGVVLGVAAALALGVLGLQQLVPSGPQTTAGAGTAAAGASSNSLENDLESGSADMSRTLRLHSATLAVDVRAAVAQVQTQRRSELFSPGAPPSPGPGSRAHGSPAPTPASGSAGRPSGVRAAPSRHPSAAKPRNELSATATTRSSCRLPAEPPPNAYLASLDGQPALVVVPPARDGSIVASVLTCDGARRTFRVPAQ